MRPPRQRKPRGIIVPEVVEPAPEVEPVAYPEAKPVPATPYVVSPGGTLHVAGCLTSPTASKAIDVDSLRARLGRSLVYCPTCEPAPRWWLTFRGSPVT